MKYKVTLDDLRLISIGFIPALVALYIIYYLAYFLVVGAIFSGISSVSILFWCVIRGKSYDNLLFY